MKKKIILYFINHIFKIFEFIKNVDYDFMFFNFKLHFD